MGAFFAASITLVPICLALATTAAAASAKQRGGFFMPNADAAKIVTVSPTGEASAGITVLTIAVAVKEHGPKATVAKFGEVYAFISGLYFRGKSGYSRAFATPPPGAPGSLVITAGYGLLPLETLISFGDLRAFAGIPIDLNEPQYRDPLERDALNLRQIIAPECEVVLLGSIATAKYLEPLVDIFGSRLLFPSEFVGRGDMSRGGLMLRSAREGVELDYIPASGAILRGRRPPKLIRLSNP